MSGRPGLHRFRSTRPANLGKNTLHLIANICLTVFVIAALVVTIIAATYEPDDPLFNSPTNITTFLSSASNSTFQSDNAVVRTGDDLLAGNQTELATLIHVTDAAETIDTSADETSSPVCEFDPKEPLDCRDPEVFQSMMQKAIERFKDIHFNRFGKPTPGPEGNTCDMAWRFRPKKGKATGFNKDYRRFVIDRLENCTVSVVSVGEYHSGVNARKKKRKNKNQIPRYEPASGMQDHGGFSLPAAGEIGNDSLPVVESEKAFIRQRYLIYVGGGDRCKRMKHYLWSFLCALGEARYLKRTLVMDMTLCLSSIYTSSKLDEEGKDFRFYFDFEHLKQAASVLDQDPFWKYWERWQKKNKLTLYLVEDFRVSPKHLTGVKHSLIMRKFGSVEPDNYWYGVCEGETGSVVRRPWHLIRKSRRLMDLVAAIGSKLNWDYDSVHIIRGEKARNRDLWPNLTQDTSPDALLSTLQNKIEDGRNVYIATNEPETSFFEPLKHKYATHFLDDYKDFWGDRSEWYSDTAKLNNGAPVEFDGYMRALVDAELFLRGKKQFETFNDLTKVVKMV
ncbi:U-box domain-containing protein 2-like [Hibiscus syriacus]|uniref:U-box domain-containing protein 2-like n=1 Tax=Hibiscus syriacus TaxID=106335 RepID=A0A6A3CTF8_HIBSY|nr:U-box domain-containing protein 2-like [Hibiscus syriacus]